MISPVHGFGVLEILRSMRKIMRYRFISSLDRSQPGTAHLNQLGIIPEELVAVEAVLRRFGRRSVVENVAYGESQMTIKTRMCFCVAICLP